MSEEAYIHPDELKLMKLQRQPKTFLDTDIRPGDTITCARYSTDKSGKRIRSGTDAIKVSAIYPFIIQTTNKAGYTECFNLGQYLCGEIVEK